MSFFILKHRVYFGSIIPIFPINTTYYKVCSNCGNILKLDKEDTKLIKNKIKGLKYRSYTKFSQLDLEADDEVVRVGGSVNELVYNVGLHVKDMK